MNSFIPWVGGKGKLLWIINKLMPDHYKRFIDVFGGSGTVTISLRKSNMKKPPLSKQHGSETPLRKTLQESNCSVTESGVQNADHL